MVIKYVKSVELNANIVAVFLEERKNTSYELRVRILNPQVTSQNSRVTNSNARVTISNP